MYSPLRTRASVGPEGPTERYEKNLLESGAPMKPSPQPIPQTQRKATPPGADPSGPDRSFDGRSIHFVGIGGCGMSGLARLLKELGAVCSGTDNVPSALTAALATEGIAVSHEQTAGAVPEDADLLIASAAIGADHPELLAAQARGIPVLSYAETLGRVQAGRTGVAIAGTHGKSTAAAMLCHVLIECGLDPSFIIGATCPQIGGGSRVGAARVPGGGPFAGRPGILVAEACEFNRSFHHHRPVLALINNVEEDHLDVYGALDGVLEAFAGFAGLLPPAGDGGRLLIAHDGSHRRRITAGLRCAVETFGFNPGADYQVTGSSDRRRVGLHRRGRQLAAWANPMPGEHNALNAAAAAVLARYLGAEWPAIAAALGAFSGLDRRMQRLGTRAVADGEVIVYDDYGFESCYGLMKAVDEDFAGRCDYDTYSLPTGQYLATRTRPL